ncbi:MAG: hypothetical protein Q4G69_14330 [Planctomycetia bacterium]|nr:hypothetical protein [Planctomycetia bacterium]
MKSLSPQEKAHYFIESETEFHLGCLPTEQSHPKTRTLSTALQTDLPAAVEMIQSVDDDIPPVLDRILKSDPFAKLVFEMTRVLSNGNRIHFSGCGATGRLSILLDSAARRFCAKALEICPELSENILRLKEQTNAVMTGGDFALIRSVESFEDYIEFGRRQMVEAGITQNDLIVAISEGGETSSVIGTIHAGLDCGASVSFLFNNPADVLVRHVKRSAEVITDPRVNVLDISTGPMAVAGSTRMQATTMELLVAGIACESAFLNLFANWASPDQIRRLGLDTSPERSADLFKTLLHQLQNKENRAVLSDYIRFESDLYKANGLITYFADQYLLDIFTDTTERAPTFKTPAFRAKDDVNAPIPWSYVKTPIRSTQPAWKELLGQDPRCLTWTSDDYRAMNGPDHLIADPPKLDRKALYRFEIGNEPDPSRIARQPNAAVAFLVGEEVDHFQKTNDPWTNAFLDCMKNFEARKKLQIVSGSVPNEPDTWTLSLDLPQTPLDLFGHLAAKLVLNTISTAALGRIGRLSGNWMAHVEASNKKLIDRSVRLIAELAEVDYETACITLYETLEEMEPWPESKKKITSPAAWSVEKIRKRRAGV